MQTIGGMLIRDLDPSDRKVAATAAIDKVQKKR
jgi:hypothetical protein